MVPPAESAVPSAEAGDAGAGCPRRGRYLYDTDGRRHLDFTAGIGVTSTGHCHPRVVAAAQEQVATLIHGQYTTVMHQPLLRLAERMGDVLPPALDAVACAAALATLDVIEDEGLVANAREQGVALRDSLRKVAADHPGIALLLLTCGAHP